jgi:hypothetical protein
MSRSNDSPHGRKVNAIKFWGLIEENEDSGKMTLTDLGRALTKNKFAHQAELMRTVIKRGADLDQDVSVDLRMLLAVLVEEDGGTSTSRARFPTARRS